MLSRRGETSPGRWDSTYLMEVEDVLAGLPQQNSQQCHHTLMDTPVIQLLPMLAIYHLADVQKPYCQSHMNKCHHTLKDTPGSIYHLADIQKLLSHVNKGGGN